MSNDAWLTAFEKLNGEGKREWTTAGFLGGAYELARVLQARVKDEPERFFGLLRRIPLDAHPAFSAWLIRFFDDDDHGVRKTAADCFRRIDPSTMAMHVPLYEAYVGSKYFDGERSYFIHRLEKAPAAMDDVVLGSIERTVEVVKADGSGVRGASGFVVRAIVFRPVDLSKPLQEGGQRTGRFDGRFRALIPAAQRQRGESRKRPFAEADTSDKRD